VRRPSGPERRNHVQVQAHSPDGDDLGEATYAQMIKPGEIIADRNQRFRVVEVVPFEEKGEWAFVGLLQV
jgi:hypothetical protein